MIDIYHSWVYSRCVVFSTIFGFVNGKWFRYPWPPVCLKYAMIHTIICCTCSHEFLTSRPVTDFMMRTHASALRTVLNWELIPEVISWAQLQKLIRYIPTSGMRTELIKSPKGNCWPVISIAFCMCGNCSLRVFELNSNKIWNNLLTVPSNMVWHLQFGVRNDNKPDVTH